MKKINVKYFLYSLIIFSVFAITCSNSKQQKATQIIQEKFEGIFNLLTSEYKQKIFKEIEHKVEDLLLSKRFNGQVLVAKNGQILYEKVQGFEDFKKNKLMSVSTPIHLASISKTFTGMAILKLLEENKLGLDDPITKYFSLFPFPNITIMELLCHRSGLPEYENFFQSYSYRVGYRKARNGRKIKYTYRISQNIPISKRYYSNQDVLAYICKYKPSLYFSPNSHFDYCNTNYVLLALIIEKISGETFPQYIKRNIFDPLGMNHSFVLSLSNAENLVPSFQPNNTPYPTKNIDFIYGEKNVYSTAEDLLKWDKCLYSENFLKNETKELAFTPHNEMRDGVHSYGLAWRMIVNPEEKIIYHNGWWHGNNTVFTRFIKDTVTVIVLGNRFNKQIYKSKSIHEVFNGSQDSVSLLE